jgi:hypothetical protein
MKKYLGHLVKIKFKDMEPIVGFVLKYNEHWILVRNIPVDYVVDGYFLVRNYRIKEVVRGDDEKWREKVVHLKLKKSKTLPKVKLSDLESILTSLTKTYKVFAIHKKEDDVCWLGRLSRIDDKSVIIDDLTPKAKWRGKFMFTHEEIRAVEFDTDYINSLKLVLNK